jgi:hypothetical protein
MHGYFVHLIYDYEKKMAGQKEPKCAGAAAGCLYAHIDG